MSTKLKVLLRCSEPTQQAVALAGAMLRAVDRCISKVCSSEVSSESILETAHAEHSIDSGHNCEPELGMYEIKLLHLSRILIATNAEKAGAITSRLARHERTFRR